MEASTGRGNWIAWNSSSVLCIEASLVAVQEGSSKVERSARLLSWHRGVKGKVSSGESDILLKRSCKLAFYNLEDLESLCLVFSLETSTSTIALDEVALVIAFSPPDEANIGLHLEQEQKEQPYPSADLPRRCGNGRQLRTVHMLIKTGSYAFPPREFYSDTVTLGPVRLQLLMHWKQSRLSLSEDTVKVSFPGLCEETEDSEMLCDELLLIVNELVHTERTDQTTDSKTAGNRGEEDHFGNGSTALTVRARENLGWKPARTIDAAVDLLSYLSPRQVAALAPEILGSLSAHVVRSSRDVMQEMESRSNLYVLFILVLSKLCDDCLFDDLSFLQQTVERIASLVSPQVLRCFLVILSRILERSNSRAWPMLLDSPVHYPSIEDDGDGNSSVSSFSSRHVPPGFHAREAMDWVGPRDRDERIKPVLLSLCSVTLVALSHARQQPIQTFQRDWKLTVESVLRTIFRLRSPVLVWMGITRLFPACLAVADAEKVCRDLKQVLQATLQALQGDDRYCKAAYGFILDSVAHLFGPFSSQSIWKAEVLPSTEEWILLHLLGPACSIASLCLRASSGLTPDSDGFDAFTKSVYARVISYKASDLPRKLDTALMSRSWALEQLWPFVWEMVRASCTREYPVSPLYLLFLQMYSGVQSNKSFATSSTSSAAGVRATTILEKKLLDMPSGERMETVQNIFGAMLVLVSVPPDHSVSLDEKDLAALAVQLLRVAVDACPALHDSTDEVSKDLWRSVLGFLLFASRCWTTVELSSWAITTLDFLLSQYLSSERHMAKVASLRLEKPESFVLLRSAAPWFVPMVVRGLIHVGCSQPSNPVLDLSIQCLNTLLGDVLCSFTVQAEIKLAIYKMSRHPRDVDVTKAGDELVQPLPGIRPKILRKQLWARQSIVADKKSLDQWVVHLEDLLTDAELRRSVFAIRTIGAALSTTNLSSSGPLCVEMLNHLLSSEYAKVCSAWLTPGPALFVRRGIDQLQGKALNGVGVAEESSEVDVLLTCMELLRDVDLEQEGLGGSRKSWSGLCQRVWQLQLRIQLLLCNALDEVGKDILVQETEVLQRDLLVAAAGTEDEAERSFLYRQTAMLVALVEDALEEGLSPLWSSFSLDVSIPGMVFAKCRMVQNGHVPARRFVAYDPNFNTWCVSAPLFLVSVADCWRELNAYGVRFDLTGRRTDDKCVTVKDPLFFPGDSDSESSSSSSSSSSESGQQQQGQLRDVHILPAHLFDKGFVAFAVSKNPGMTYRVEVEIRKHARDRREQQWKERTGIAAMLVPEGAKRVSISEVSLIEACKQKIVLSISALKGWLENEVWLPQYDENANARLLRESLYDLIASEIVDCLEPPLSGEGAVGYLAARSGGMRKDTELCNLSDSLDKVIDIAMSSLRRKCGDGSTSALKDVVAKLEELLALRLRTFTF